LECTPLTLFKKTVPHFCTAALLMAFSEFRKSKPFPLSKQNFLTPIFQNIAYFSQIRMIPFNLHNTLLCYVHFSESIATPSIIA
jgi:hypothetical protein